MIGRFAVTMLTVSALGLAPATAIRAQAEGSGEVGTRFRVLVPPLYPTANADDGFGKDAADKLRDLINTLPTHQPVPQKEMKAALKRYKLETKDLDCIRTRQLASRINAQVALCADYHRQGDDQEMLDATFYDVASGDSFRVKPHAFAKKKPDLAARYIFDTFHTYVEQLSAARDCNLYAQSKDFANAMPRCDRSLQLNPDAVGSRYTKADILFQEEKYDAALEELKRILAQDPNHQNALSLAGYISAKLGKDEDARAYYEHYLQLDPSDVQVRMKIAYDLGRAGDPVGAMQLIQKGLAMAPDNADLLTQYAAFAFNAALKVDTAGSEAGDSAGIPAEAATYYRDAVQAGEKVLAAKGSETPVVLLRNSIAAYLKLKEAPRALALGRRALVAHPTDAGLWSAYATALHENGQIDPAIAALDSARKLDPSNAMAGLKQGSWLIGAGRLSDALAVLRPIATSTPEDADRAAQLIMADAYANGVKKEHYDYAAKGMAAALKLPNLSEGLQRQLNFWDAYSIYRGAITAQKPLTLATARATLPRFRHVLELLRHVGDYPKTVGVPLGRMVANCRQYVEIQQAIIKRGK